MSQLIQSQSIQSQPMIFHIIGLGVSQTAQLSPQAINALQQADSVLGSVRQIAVIESHLMLQPTSQMAQQKTQQKTHYFPKFSELPAWLEAQQTNGHKNIVILASGDPLYFGIGRWFSQQYPTNQLHFYPAVSSIQAACHELGLSLQDVDVISLHGRPLKTLRRHIKQNQTLLMMTDQNSTPAALAEECQQLGFIKGQLHVCEKLGYDNQTIRTFELNDPQISQLDFDPLHVSIISTQNCERYSAEFPGIPDAQFITDGEHGKGMITKREVRLSILSMMQPTRGDVIWDIGAGCGSVAIELALWQTQHVVVAIEHHDDRLRCLKANQEKFGVLKNLLIVSGRAPDALEELKDNLAQPNKIFIGGSDGELTLLLKQCWHQLPIGGTLMASAVTEDTKFLLMSFFKQREECKDAEFESSQIIVNRAGQLAGQLLYRPNLPVTLFKWVKYA